MRKYLSTVYRMYREPKWVIAAFLVMFTTATLKASELEAENEEKKQKLYTVRMIISAVWYAVYFKSVIKRMKGHNK